MMFVVFNLHQMFIDRIILLSLAGWRLDLTFNWKDLVTVPWSLLLLKLFWAFALILGQCLQFKSCSVYLWNTRISRAFRNVTWLNKNIYIFSLSLFCFTLSSPYIDMEPQSITAACPTFHSSKREYIDMGLH